MFSSESSEVGDLKQQKLRGGLGPSFTPTYNTSYNSQPRLQSGTAGDKTCLISREQQKGMNNYIMKLFNEKRFDELNKTFSSEALYEEENASQYIFGKETLESFFSSNCDDAYGLLSRALTIISNPGALAFLVKYVPIQMLNLLARDDYKLFHKFINIWPTLETMGLPTAGEIRRDGAEKLKLLLSLDEKLIQEQIQKHKEELSKTFHEDFALALKNLSMRSKSAVTI